MIKVKSRNKLRQKRHLRIRKTLVGTAVRPRLNVFRSSKNISAQLIDDINGVTLASASTIEKDSKIENGGNKEAAKAIGTLIAERASNRAIVFDLQKYLLPNQPNFQAIAAHSQRQLLLQAVHI